MQLRKICEGYATYYDPETVKAMKKAGAEYVWSGVRSSDSVVGIVKTGGMSSTNRRCLNGVRLTGSSPESDMGTGGADSVFTRLGVKTGARFNTSYWGAFGTTAPSRMAQRLTPVDFVKQMKQSYRSDNEIMFRQGIPVSSFTGIVCEDTAKRAELIQKFQAEGITEINGKPLGQFIKVGKPY